MQPSEPPGLSHTLDESPTVCGKRLALVTSLVVAAAVAVRMPSCYQSFWLDELHSAWTVWGDLNEVGSRAARGHQSPFYFYALWFWKQVAGESELMLRMSSVLALAASCAVLTVGVARWTASLAAGATAGLVLASESNAIFFGTELRPYALVVFFSSVAVGLFLPLFASSSRQSCQRTWLALVAAILLAVLSQPTSLGVLASLPVVLAIVWCWRDLGVFFRFTLSDALALIATAAVGFALWQVTAEVWDQRSQWNSFAAATRVGQIGEAWDWTWLLGVPLAMLLAAAIWASAVRKSVGHITTVALWLAAIAVAATCFFWLVARWQWFPVWHRRYFIAVLPIFACVAGGGVGALAAVIPPGWKRVTVAAFAVAVLVIGLARHQGTLARLPHYPVNLAIRGENWRGAVAWINSHATRGDRLYLDSGLIEAIALANSPQPFTHAIPPDQREYLSYPLRGPYRAEGTGIELVSGFFANRIAIPDGGTALVLTRRPGARVQELARGSQAVGFGNLWIVVMRADSLPHQPK